MIPHKGYSNAPAANKDSLYTIIKNFRNAFPDAFEKCNLKICSVCEGSGIVVESNESSEITLWQPGHYCPKCKGFGVMGINRIYDEYLCKECKGEGCKKCKNRGTVDWISNIMKG